MARQGYTDRSEGRGERQGEISQNIHHQQSATEGTPLLYASLQGSRLDDQRSTLCLTDTI